MLNPVKSKVYLVTIYNKVVRALVKENQTHTFYSDLWADAHTQDVTAETEAEARSIATHRFPPEDGFVIEHIEPAS